MPAMFILARSSMSNILEIDEYQTIILKDTLEHENSICGHKNENNLVSSFLCVFIYFADQEILLSPQIYYILFLGIKHTKYFKAFTNSNPMDGPIPKHYIFVLKSITVTCCICHSIVSLYKKKLTLALPHIFLSIS